MKGPEDFPLSWGQAAYVLVLFLIGLVGGAVANFYGTPKQGGFDKGRERAAAVLGAFAGASVGLFTFLKTGLALAGIAVTMAGSLIGDVLRKALADYVEAWVAKRTAAEPPPEPEEPEPGPKP